MSDKGVTMGIWERVNEDITSRRFNQQCDEKMKWLSRQNIIEFNLENIARKVNKMLEEVEKSKHDKIGEWLNSTTDKRAKESALLFEMMEYGLSMYNLIKEKEMDNNKLAGCYCKRNKEAYDILVSKGFVFRGKINSEYYMIYGGNVFGSPESIGEAREVKVINGSFKL